MDRLALELEPDVVDDAHLLPVERWGAISAISHTSSGDDADEGAAFGAQRGPRTGGARGVQDSMCRQRECEEEMVSPQVWVLGVRSLLEGRMASRGLRIIARS